MTKHAKVVLALQNLYGKPTWQQCIKYRSHSSDQQMRAPRSATMPVRGAFHNVEKQNKKTKQTPREKNMFLEIYNRWQNYLGAH